MVKPGEFVECASETCWKVFRRGEGCGDEGFEHFCSRECRHMNDHLLRNSVALDRALCVMRALETADIYDAVGRRHIKQIYENGRVTDEGDTPLR